MTITLGILASDGIVIAADTELSWGEAYRKTEGAKIAIVEDAGIAIAGAGDAGYIDALSQELHRTIIQTKSDKISDVGRAVQANLTKFHREHILPWKDPSLDVWLIIGLERAGQRVLWVTHKATLRPCVCAAVGAGSSEADALLTQLFGVGKNPAVTLAMAQSIAAYIAHVAKDRVPGCGKNTDIVRIEHGKAEQLSRATVGLFERSIGDLLELQTRVAQFALGYIVTNDPRQQADELARFFVTIRREFEEDWRADSRRWTLGGATSGRSPLVPVNDPSATPLVLAQSVRKSKKPVRQGSKRGRQARPPSPE